MGAAIEIEETESIRAATGATASIEERDGVSRILVHDERGALIFEHLPGKSIVYAPSGNLELRADSGSIDLVARESVRIESARAVVVKSDEAVHLEASPTSRVSILRRALVMASPLVSARAARAELEADRVNVTAREATSTIEHVKHVVEVLETNAGRILERAKESYRDTEGLAQTRAGRLRLVAEKTLSVLGQRTLIKAYEDMKLRGEKIYIS
jgi:hypothetical protein